MLDSVSMAGLNCLRLMNDTTAATPSKVNSTSPKQNPVIPTPKSLNPFAPEFEVSPFARDNPYYPADCEMGYPPFSTFCSFLQRESKLPAIP